MPGSAQCIAKLALKQKQFESLGRKGLQECTLEVLGRSKEMCPVKTGKLRRSGNTRIIKNTITNFYMRISYPVVYAAAVHEIPMQHNVGSMKYLATPFNLMSHRLLKTLEAEMKKAI